MLRGSSSSFNIGSENGITTTLNRILSWMRSQCEDISETFDLAVSSEINA